MRRTLVIFGGLAVVLAGMLFSIAQKERVLAQGRVVLLELAPVDPRSLMQGDYMQLDYAIARALTQALRAWPRDGRLVLAQGPGGVARFVRRHEGGPLAPGELLLRYRVRDGRLRLGAESFLFQEGHAERYARARYGELRVEPDGDSVLAGLRSAERVPLR
jgi:uncharacterized membrane-anchored protein